MWRGLADDDLINNLNWLVFKNNNVIKYIKCIIYNKQIQIYLCI